MWRSHARGKRPRRTQGEDTDIDAATARVSSLFATLCRGLEWLAHKVWWLLLVVAAAGGRFAAAELVQSGGTKGRAKARRLARPGGVCGQVKGERVRGGWMAVCVWQCGCLCCASTPTLREERGFTFAAQMVGGQTAAPKAARLALSTIIGAHTMHRHALRRSAWDLVGLVSVLDDHPSPLG